MFILLPLLTLTAATLAANINSKTSGWISTLKIKQPEDNWRASSDPGHKHLLDTFSNQVTTLKVMSAEQEFIEARQKGYYEAMKSGVIENILHFMSKDVNYSDISMNSPLLLLSVSQTNTLNLAWNVLDMNYTTFTGFVTQFYGGAESMKIESKAVSGTRDFVAWEWYMEFIPKEDNQAFGLSKGKMAKLNGVSLVWWKNEGGNGGYKGWRVVKCKDFSSRAPGQ
jgi:hypothetical protein